VNKRAVVITICNAVLLFGLVLLYSAADAFASFTGPKDDIGMLALLVPFIFWHALLIGRHGLRTYRSSALALLAVLSLLLAFRYHDALVREGWWHANRSIHVFVWCCFWFGCAAFVARWRAQRYDRRREQLIHSVIPSRR
jgi:hypothetical protein